MYRYKSETGLDFMVKRDRDKIIMMLSLLQEVARKQVRPHLGDCEHFLTKCGSWCLYFEMYLPTHSEFVEDLKALLQAKPVLADA
jgi:hypothetical protein